MSRVRSLLLVCVVDVLQVHVESKVFALLVGLGFFLSEWSLHFLKS